MSVATITPQPKLAAIAAAARQEARTEKRRRNPLRRAARVVAILFAVLFATLGLGAGTAQAWPWTDMEEDITAFVTNFCGPMDVPAPVGTAGIDNLFALNTDESTNRATVKPNVDELGASPVNGLERIQAAYADKTEVISPTYDRYGFTALQWDSFGAGCFSTGYWFTPVANMALNAFVIFPMIIAMATLQFALGNILYTVFTGVISPFVSIFTAIFQGWALWIAPIGLIWAFIRSKGNLRPVLKTAVWMLMILGAFVWMGANTSTVVTKANNFVTEFATTAATKINDVNGVSTGTGGDAVDAINQSLWYGVPYQTWLEGTVGPTTAAEDRVRVSNGEVSWGAVILNSKFVGDDEDGRAIVASINRWNSLSYSPNEKFSNDVTGNPETKPGAWTKGTIWKDIPYLFTVKAMCGDTSNGAIFTSSSAEQDNRWFYGGSCDSAGAGTSDMIPAFTGTDYNARLTVAISGGVAAFAVCLAIGIASIYLGVQKMLFYFMLLFGPVFLTVSLWGDEKRTAFAKRYFEMLIGNLIKQGVAVLVVLFIANAMSMLLYPPADEKFAALRELPWMLKPSLAMLFLIALALFLVPMKKIVSGAVKGDTKVVDKTLNAPVDAAKTAAKVATGVVVGAAAVAAVVATGGAAAPVVGKLGGMAMSAGKMAGGRGAVGKALTTVGRGANLASRMGTSIVDNGNKKKTLANLAQNVFSKDPNAQAQLAKVPGAVGEGGKLTAKGQAIMSNAIQQTSKQGEQAARAEAMQKSYMDRFYKGHLATTGTHHPSDPSSPENMRAAAVERERDRQSVREEAKHGSVREQNMASEPSAAPGTVAATATTVPVQTREQHAEAVRENVSGPGFAQEQSVKANVTVSGAQIADGLGMSPREIAQDPAALLAGSAYNGGDTSMMDPRNPATAALTDLKFAMIAGSSQATDEASMRASEAITQYGVPSEVSSVSAGWSSPEGMAHVVGAMPTITPETTWQERAEGATTMQAAMSFVPADSPAYEPMQNYVRALSDPNVDASTVEGMRSLAIENAGPPPGGFDDYTPINSGAWDNFGDLGPAIHAAAQRVEAAPSRMVEEQGAMFGQSVPSWPEAPSGDGGWGPEYDFGPPTGAPEASWPEPPSSWQPDEYPQAQPTPQADSRPEESPAWSMGEPPEPPAWASSGPAERPERPAWATGEATPSSSSRGRHAEPANEEAPEEISGMPSEQNADNSVPFERSKRRRVSGFFDTDEDDNPTDGA